jgi:hypothetical protein
VNSGSYALLIKTPSHQLVGITQNEFGIATLVVMVAVQSTLVTNLG